MYHMIADAATAAGEGRGNFMQTILMVGLALLFFYFILWRPEQKRRKQLEAKRSSLKKGDRVTAMGIVGTIVKLGEETVTIATGDTKIEMLKPAITDVQPQASSEPSEEADSKS